MRRYREKNLAKGGELRYETSITDQPGFQRVKTNRDMTRDSRKRVVGLLAACAGLLVLAGTGLAQAPPFEWVRQAGGAGYDRALAVAADAEGGVVVVGHYERDAFFGTNAFTTPASYPRVFIASYDANGVLRWVRSPATTSDAWGLGLTVAVDRSGDVYIGGVFVGIFDFGGLTITNRSPPGEPPPPLAYFVAKYSRAGSALWARVTGSAGYNSSQLAVAIDPWGNMHEVGTFEGSVSFGSVNLTSAGDTDMFHAKYDPAGNVLWAKKGGGLDADSGSSIAADLQGNTIVCGEFGLVANFDGVVLTNSNTSGRDIFITKYDTNGAVLWTKSAGVTSVVFRARAAGVDLNDNIFVAGDLDDGTTGFLSKFSSAGDLLWTRNTGASAASVAPAPSGDVYISGNFRGISIFGQTNLTSRGEDDFFIARYSASGSLLWVKQAGFIYWDFAEGIALDPVGNIYVAGSFYDTFSFDGTTITGRGDYDMFVAKLPASAPGALLVTTTNDSGPSSLRQAMQDANAIAGDNTIQILAAGTIVLSSPLPLITANTVIEQMSTNLTISGNGRVGMFTIAAGTTNTFRGLTIANGWLTNQNGAAISNGGTLAVVACKLMNNLVWGADGGAIFNSGNLTLQNSLLSDNQVRPGTDLANPSLGGGIYNSGNLLIDTSTLSGNMAYGPGATFGSGQPGGHARGGALWTGLGTVTVTNSLLVGNRVFGGSGAVPPTSATGAIGGIGEGGGIFIQSGNVAVIASTLSGNVVTGGGGGSANQDTGLCQGVGGKGGQANGGAITIGEGSLSLLNSTLSGNLAWGGGGGNRQSGGDGGDGRGGAIFANSGSAFFFHATTTENEARGGGGGGYVVFCSPWFNTNQNGNAYGSGIYRAAGSVSLRNSIVAGNKLNPNTFRFKGLDVFGSFTSQGHNLFGQTNDASGFIAADLLNIYDAKLGPLQDNGGMTPTHALLPDSPALDAAAPDPAITVDQRGVSRPQGSAPDIGAFELTVFLPAFVDTFAARRAIGGYTNYVTGTNTFYTKEPGEPQHADRKGAHSAWISWVAPDSGTCVLDTFGTEFDTVLAVYTGLTMSNLTLVAANDDATPGTLQSQVSFETTAGTAYQIAVDGYGTNDAGSMVFHLDFSGQQLPTIITQPQSQTVVAGSDVTFLVEATGTLPINFKWRRNGATILNNPPRTNIVINSSSSTLTLLNVQSNQVGNYTVLLTNLASAGILSAVAGLTVLEPTNQPPAIITQPLSQTVAAGNNTTLSVTANGTPPLSYQWRFNDVDIADATNFTLPFPNVQPTNGGNYTVMVTNSFGAVTSMVATLTVLLPPSIVTQPQSQTVTAGSDVSFNVVATSDLPLSYQWQFNSADIPNETSVTLTIPNAQPVNEGSYRVIVSNAAGSVTSEVATLMVILTNPGGIVVSWPLGSSYPAPPDLTNVVAVANGEQSVIALTRDGKVVAWGECCAQPRPNQIDSLPNLSDVVAIASGGFHALALLRNGTVIGWGNDQFGQASVPPGLKNVSAIACGGLHSLALTSNGTVVAWGRNNYGESSVPSALANVVAIGAGDFHSLAVRENGTVIAWGAGGPNSGPDWNYRQSVVPSGLSNVVAATGGQGHSLALKRDGTVMGWGANDAGQINVPASVTNAVAIACGAGHNVALRSDGTVIMWGWGASGETNVPPGLTNVAAVDATYNRTSAIVGDGSPVITVQPFSRTVPRGRTTVLLVMAAGSPPVNYQWQANGTDLPGATNAMLVITNVQFANIGQYSVVLNNSKGTTTSATATLQVVEGSPFITQQPLSQTVVLGSNATFSVAANGTPPINYQWQLKATNLPSQTNPTLSITNVQPANEGFYRVILSNSVGTSTSSIAALVVVLPAVKVTIQGQGVVTKSPDKPFYNVGEQVTLTATPARWFGFTRWGDGPTINPRVITIGASNSYTAIFSPITPLETLTFNNVSRTAPVGMPALFVDGQFVSTGTVSRLDSAQLSMLTTFPNGSIFFTLNGSEPSFDAELYDGSFILRRSATVRAVAYDASFLNSWESDPVQVIIEPTFAVNVSTPGGGTVGVSPGGASYRSNTVVTLTATPAPGWTFLQWLGDASGTNAITSVRVFDRDLCAQALFGTTLNITIAGNGTVMADPMTTFYPYGTVARLTAIPQSGNYFGAWGNAVMSTNNPLLFPVTNANPAVSGVFGSLNAGQVALAVLVNGHGRVSTSPRGNRFTSGQSVMLSAMPDASQEFLGWTGDASGTSTNLTLTLTQSKVITANFTKRPRLFLGPCLGGWRDDGFQFLVMGEFGGHYRLDYSSTLPNWSPLGSVTNVYGVSQMIDPASINTPTRFYRAVEEP